MRDEIIIDLLKDVHESVPRFLLGTMPRIHHSWAHPIGLLNTWKMREPHFLPERIRPYVCLSNTRSDDPLRHTGFSNKRGTPVCKECELPFVYLFFYCIKCGTPFIRDFDDSRFCSEYPHCYLCLPDLGWDFCKDHVLPVRLRSYQMRGVHTAHKPNGLNPKVYSEQEIADAFAFLNE